MDNKKNAFWICLAIIVLLLVAFRIICLAAIYHRKSDKLGIEMNDEANDKTDDEMNDLTSSEMNYQMSNEMKGENNYEDSNQMDECNCFSGNDLN